MLRVRVAARVGLGPVLRLDTWEPLGIWMVAFFEMLCHCPSQIGAFSGLSVAKKSSSFSSASQPETHSHIGFLQPHRNEEPLMPACSEG